MRSSSRRLLSPIAVILGLALFVPTGPAWALPHPKLPPEATDKPSAVVRIRPVDELLKDARTVAKLIDRGTDDFDVIAPMLAAIDTTKPIGFYALIKPEPVNSIGVLMIPVKEPKALLDVLAGFGQNPTEDDGLYSLNAGVPFKVLFRFENGYAYATVRNSQEAEAVLAKNKLYAPERIFQAKDDSLASVTFNLDAIPNALKEKGLDRIDEFMQTEIVKYANAGSPHKEVHEAAVTEIARRGQMLITDALTVNLRFDFDRTKETMGVNFRLTARKGTVLAEEIVRKTPGEGLGDAILGDPSAIKLAVFAVLPETLKNTLDPLVDRVLGQIVEKAEALRADAKDVADALAPTLKSGLLDLGIDVRGPRADGFATLLIGLRLVDGDKLDAALRRLVGNIGAKEREPITFDVAKVEGVSIHRIAPKQLDKGMRDLVGDDAKIYVAMRKNFLLVGFGAEPETLAALRDALKAGPKACKLLEGEMAMRNLAKILERKREGAVAAAKKAFPEGADDVIRYSITGGDAIEARVTSSIRLILFLESAR